MKHNNTFTTNLKKKEWKRNILIILSLLFFIYCLYQIGVFNSFYPSGFKRFINHLRDLFTFKNSHPELSNKNLWVLNFEYLFITLKSVVGGSIFGYLLAFLTSYSGAKNINKNKYLAFCIRWLVIFLRSFPLIMYLFLFQGIFSPYLSAFFIFFWSTWLWVHKFLIQIIENNDCKYYWIDRSLGVSKYSSFKKNIYLPSKNRYTMNMLLSLDTNIRWSSILGSIGIVGIGFWIENNKTQFIYLGISLLYIYLITVFFEVLMSLYNNYLKDYLYKVTFNTNYHKTVTYNLPKYIWGILKLLFLVILVWSLVELFSNQHIQWNILWLFLKDFFNWDFSDLVNNSFNDYYDYFLIIINVYAAVYSAYWLSVLYSFFMSEKTDKVFLSWFLRGFLVFLKTIPIVVFFILFNSFLDSLTVLNIVLFISAFRTLVKHLVSKINSFSNDEINLYRTLGLKDLQIYFQKIYPSIQKDIFSLIFFEYESTFRNALTYGIFSSISLTSKIQYYHERNIYNTTIPLLLPSILFFITLEIIYYLYKNNWKVPIPFNWTKALIKKYK